MELVAAEQVCIGGTQGCGLDGMHIFPIPVTLRKHVDYAIVARGLDRIFTGHTITGDEFYVFGQRVTRTAFVKETVITSDGVYPAGIFRIINARGTIR